MEDRISLSQFKKMLKSAAGILLARADTLTEIDGKFGDGDHGLTMSKVAEALSGGTVRTEEQTVYEFCDSLSTEMMFISGGSASSLWGTFFEGFAAAAEGLKDELSSVAFQKLLRGGLQALCEVSTARVGGKTMMDALIPAVEAAENAGPGFANILRAAAEAAEIGKESTKALVSHYGRARSYGERTIGTPDAGAVSTAYFFEGLLVGYENMNS